jgi:hypothetical protein
MGSLPGLKRAFKPAFFTGILPAFYRYYPLTSGDITFRFSVFNLILITMDVIDTL